MMPYPHSRPRYIQTYKLTHTHADTHTNTYKHTQTHTNKHKTHTHAHTYTHTHTKTETSEVPLKGTLLLKIELALNFIFRVEMGSRSFCS